MIERKLPNLFNEDLLPFLDSEYKDWDIRLADQDDLKDHCLKPNRELLRERTLGRLSPVIRAVYIALNKKVAES